MTHNSGGIAGAASDIAGDHRVAAWAWQRTATSTVKGLPLMASLEVPLHTVKLYLPLLRAEYLAGTTCDHLGASQGSVVEHDRADLANAQPDLCEAPPAINDGSVQGAGASGVDHKSSLSGAAEQSVVEAISTTQSYVTLLPCT